MTIRARRDISATDPAWEHHCGHRHQPGTPCPPSAVWLVLAMCRDCMPRTGAYCRRHDTKGTIQ
jgi:hypothetical protein